MREEQNLLFAKAHITAQSKKEYVKVTKDEGLKDDIEECKITLFSN